MRPAYVPTACAILLVLTAAPARADEVIVLQPIVPSDFAARLRERLAEEAMSHLAAAGLTVRQGADIDVAVRAASDCRDARCLREKLGATGARLAARIRIDPTPDGNGNGNGNGNGWTARLEVTSLAAGVVLATEEADCSGCSAQAATEVALSLIDGIEVPETDPAPPREPTQPPAPAPPRVRPRQPEIDLGARPQARRGISKWVWISGAAGLALVAGGIPLLIMDGDPTCDGPRQSCPEVYDTRTGGWSLVAIGVAGIAAAVVMAFTGAPGETGTETRGLGTEP